MRGLFEMKRNFKYQAAALLLAFIIVFCACPTKQVQAEDYRGWSQVDSRWGSIRLGSSYYTVKSSGCLVTSVTKLLIQSGLRDADDFNVKTMTKWMNRHGGFTSGGLFCWDKVSSYESKFKYCGTIMSYSYYSASSYNAKLLKWIKQGYHMVIAVKGAGHWVAVDEAKSLKTGKIYIMDSANSKQSLNKNVKLSSRYGTFNRVVAFKGGKIAKTTNTTSKKADSTTTKKTDTTKTQTTVPKTEQVAKNAVDTYQKALEAIKNAKTK